MQYDGTLILVSHDRDFLQGLVNKVYEFTDKKAKEHLGTIQEFLDRKKIENFRELEKSKSPSQPKPAVSTPVPESKINQEKNIELRKANEKEIKRINNLIKKSEENIQQIEQDIEAMNEVLIKPENASNMKLFDDYQQLQKKLENEMKNWEECSLQMERLSK